MHIFTITIWSINYNIKCKCAESHLDEQIFLLYIRLNALHFIKCDIKHAITKYMQAKLL